MIHDSALVRLGVLPGAAAALALPVQAVLGKGDVVLARCLVGRMAGLSSHALAPRPIRGRVDECTLAGARHVPPLLVCGLNGPGLRSAAGTVRFACTL